MTQCEFNKFRPLYPPIAWGDTDDVPNTVDHEASSTPESSAVLHDIHSLGFRIFVASGVSDNQ
ncbi:MAG: hypothetical protein ACKVH8_05240 [Pirellulales bacterium]